MISFTPTEELPLPPSWMLEELEKEYQKYNTFLLQQIFTIRECRPIRNAFRSKMQRTPSAKALHAAFGKRIERTNNGEITDESLYEGLVKAIRKKPNFCDTINGYINKDFNKAIRYKTKKDKISGQKEIKPGMWQLAENLKNCWDNEMQHGIFHPRRQKVFEKLIKCGFNKWLIHNMNRRECQRFKKNSFIYYHFTEIPK